jgi:D-galactarolactone cycloisomerase
MITDIREESILTDIEIKNSVAPQYLVIKKIEAFVVSHQLKQSFYFSQWEYDRRLICLVKITLDDGTFGWGEGYGPALVIIEGIEFFKPLLIGQNPLENECLWQKMYLRSLDYGRRGIFLSAISALDVALWDIKGKLLNQPVSVLLGGRKREKIKAYATGMYFSQGNNLDQKLAREAYSYKKRGFEAMKMKVGLGIKEDIKNVQAVREAIGYDIELMIDSNHAYSLKEALFLCRKVEKFEINWFEEPLSPEEYDNYFYLRQKTSIPIAGGECEYLRYGFLHLFQSKSVDIAQPDICSAGGLTEVKKICCMAQTFGVEVVPHTWGTGIAVSAALHLISNWDITPGRLHTSVPMIELDLTENPLRDALINPSFTVENGMIEVPDKPGLGVDVDETELKKYLL